MAVYLLAVGQTEPQPDMRVKVGFAVSVHRRIAALQAAHWEPLHLLKSWPGDKTAEAWMHARFAARRIVREWFWFDPEMLVVEPVSSPPALIATGTDEALPVIERFLQERRMSPTTFGIAAVGDPMLVPELRNGRDLRRATRSRVFCFIAEQSNIPTVGAIP